MEHKPNKMPLSLVAIQAVGTILVVAGVLVMYVAKPAPSSSPRLFEILIMTGVLCYLVFAFRCWRWVKRNRSRQASS